MIVRVMSAVALACALLATPASAQPPAPSDNHDQQGYWAHWFDRSDEAKATQPHWLTPVATTTPRLEQEFRYDVVWQQARDGAPWSETFGAGKGLELIPFENVEVIVGLPSYVAHHNSAVEDGFGDFRLLVKYRLLAAPEEQGNYIVTAFVDVSFPTGSANIGQDRSVVTPTLAYGKGVGRFDLQGTFSAALPTGDEARIGRTYAWNNAVQYHLLRRFWPEVEVNATFFEDGRYAGAHQIFITPGLVIGRLPLAGRVGLTVGAGVQLAVTAFHTSAHNAILSVRLPF